MENLKPSLNKLLLEKAKKKKKEPPVLISTVSFILKKVAHPTRLSVIYLLEKQGQMSVNTMVEILECEQSLLSHHLSELREIGLLKAERKGQQIFYSVTDTNLSSILHAFEDYSLPVSNP